MVDVLVLLALAVLIFLFFVLLISAARRFMDASTLGVRFTAWTDVQCAALFFVLALVGFAAWLGWTL